MQTDIVITDINHNLGTQLFHCIFGLCHQHFNSFHQRIQGVLSEMTFFLWWKRGILFENLSLDICCMFVWFQKGNYRLQSTTNTLEFIYAVLLHTLETPYNHLLTINSLVYCLFIPKRINLDHKVPPCYSAETA